MALPPGRTARLTTPLAGIVAAALVLGLVPITLASHAALTIEPADTYQRHGGTANVRAATDAPGMEVSFEVISSSNPGLAGQLNVDYAKNGGVRDFACTTAADTSGGYSCTVSYLDLTLADTTDTLRAWIDEDPADGVFAAGESFVDVAFSWGADLRLQVTPESSSSRTGTLSTITASVTNGLGMGIAGIAVDFEVVSGPGDDDVGTAGDTRATPDMACVTSGGGLSVAASCAVSYTEGANVGGDDLILAWVDLDGSDATVEADGGEGPDETAAGTPGCVAGGLGGGWVSEPDYTDCVVHSWVQRVPRFVNAEPESSTGAVGSTVSIDAIVYDQDGNPFVGVGTDAHVRFYFEGVSPNDPGSPGNSSDFDCHTGTTGVCTGTYVPAFESTDLICALVDGPRKRCDETLDFTELDDNADIVERVIGSGSPTPTPTPTPTPAPTPTPPPPLLCARIHACRGWLRREAVGSGWGDRSIAR